MKRIIVLISIALLSLCASAQDLIVKKDGTIIKAKVTKVSETEIEYRNFGSASDRIYTLMTSGILAINYEDGTVEKFSVQEQNIQSQDIKEPKIRKAGPDPEANMAKIEALNALEASYSKNKPNKKADFSILKLAVAPQSVLVSNDLSISAEMGSIYLHRADSNNKNSRMEFGSYYERKIDYSFYYVPAIKFNVTNRTDQTLYLDLGNTFLSVGGQTVPYYVPGAQSTTTTTSKGTSVNLGAVAGAMGVGGALGTLASGVNVGGGNSTSSNNVVFSQRIVAVAPFSRVSLEEQVILDDNLIYQSGDWGKIKYPVQIMQGEKIEFSEESSPLTLRFYLSYSSTEDCDRLNCMEVVFYSQSICGFGDYSPKYLNFSKESLIIISILDNKR